MSDLAVGDFIEPAGGGTSPAPLREVMAVFVVDDRQYLAWYNHETKATYTGEPVKWKKVLPRFQVGHTYQQATGRDYHVVHVFDDGRAVVWFERNSGLIDTTLLNPQPGFREVR